MACELVEQGCSVVPSAAFIQSAAEPRWERGRGRSNPAGPPSGEEGEGCCFTLSLCRTKPVIDPNWYL